MKYGIIYCCYGNSSYIDDCLSSWLELKKNHNILIAAVHGQFKEYHDNGYSDNDIESLDKLIKYNTSKDIDYLYIQNNYSSINYNKVYQTEAEIRDKGLQWLLKQNCDYIWILDNDEFYTAEQIEKIINYINLGSNSFESWFSIPFKNYIFSGNEYIKDFCPPRVFRVKPYGDLAFKLDRFYWDNDVIYRCADEEWSYKKLSSKKIPEALLDDGIKHLTWLHSNGQKKYEYQMKHFGHCGYKWNYDNKKLEFNLDFYKKNGLQLPIIYND